MGGVWGAFAGGGGVRKGWGGGVQVGRFGGTCPQGQALVHHRLPLPPLALPLTTSRRNIGTELVGKALCFVTLLCLETIRQSLSLDVVQCYHMGYLSHTPSLPLPWWR